MSKQNELVELSRVYNTSALSNRNIIINGAAVLDQRNSGSSVTASTGTYTLDRWRSYNSTDGAFTVQQVSDSPDDFSYSIKVTATTADSSLASGQQAKVQQKIEGYNVASFALGSSGAKSFTLSFYVKSSVTGTYAVGFINSANNRSFVSSYTINSANTWEYKTITLDGDTTGTWLTTNGVGLNIQWSLGMGSDWEGTSGSWQTGEKSDASGFTKLIGTLNATWQITGVQLELGNAATPFEHRSYGDELARCQRYYIKHVTNSINGQIVMHQDRGGANYFGELNWMQEMRVAPTVTGTGMDRVHKPGIIYDTISTGPNFYQASVNGMYILAVSTNTHATSSTAFLGASSGGSINIDAEL